jgi:hypothetical protein
MVDETLEEGGPEMGELCLKMGKKIGKILLVNIIGYMIWCGVKNELDGKTLFGKKKEPKKKTYVDWNDNIHLGTEDGWVA